MHATSAPTQTIALQLQTLWSHIMRESGGFMRVLEDLDLSLTQVKALHMLDGRGRLSVKQLGECVGLSPAAASRAADGLVSRGLVERAEDPNDRRARVVTLTEAGRAAVQRVVEARLDGLAAFVDTLERAERDALAAALAPIVDRISK